MKRFKTIGVLGGIGPVATAHFFQTLLSHAQEDYDAVQDHEYPHVIINSLAAENTNEKGFEDGEDDAVLAQLGRGLRSLERAGAEIVAIPCNTAHKFIDELRAASRAPVINMVEEVVRRVKHSGAGNVCVLSSESSARSCVYTRLLERERIDCHHAHSKELVDATSSLILDVMGGKVDTRNKALLLQMMMGMKDRGVDGVVLGCTELSVAIRRHESPTMLYDSLEILAETALYHALNRSKGAR